MRLPTISANLMQGSGGDIGGDFAAPTPIVPWRDTFKFEKEIYDDDDNDRSTCEYSWTFEFPAHGWNERPPLAVDSGGRSKVKVVLTANIRVDPYDVHYDASNPEFRITSRSFDRKPRNEIIYTGRFFEEYLMQIVDAISGPPPPPGGGLLPQFGIAHTWPSTIELPPFSREGAPNYYSKILNVGRTEDISSEMWQIITIGSRTTYPMFQAITLYDKLDSNKVLVRYEPYSPTPLIAHQRQNGWTSEKRRLKRVLIESGGGDDGMADSNSDYDSMDESDDGGDSGANFATAAGLALAARVVDVTRRRVPDRARRRGAHQPSMQWSVQSVFGSG